MDEPGENKVIGSEQPDQGITQVQKEASGLDKPEVQEQPHPYEELLDDYPLREPGDDPVWSVRIVKIWMWFLAFATGGIVLLLILGLFYD